MSLVNVLSPPPLSYVVENIDLDINFTATTSYSVIYTYTAPCDGYLNLIVCPLYVYSKPVGSIIATSTSGEAWNTLDRHETNCYATSISGKKMNYGTQIYVLTKYETVGSGQNRCTITGQFIAI